MIVYDAVNDQIYDSSKMKFQTEGPGKTRLILMQKNNCNHVLFPNSPCSGQVSIKIPEVAYHLITVWGIDLRSIR